MPRQTMCPGDNLPRETTCPGDNVSQKAMCPGRKTLAEKICPGENVPWFLKRVGGEWNLPVQGIQVEVNIYSEIDCNT